MVSFTLSFMFIFFIQLWVSKPHRRGYQNMQPELFKDWHRSLRVYIILQDHSPRVDINENQKTTVQQSPPLAMMETLRHGNSYAHAPPDCMPLSLHALFFISPPLTSMEMDTAHLEMIPLSTSLC